VTGIFVIGASSTGKTTICQALARRLEEKGFCVFHIAEVARSVMQNHGFTRDDVATLAMQQTIMQAQILEEKKCLVSIENSRFQLKDEPGFPCVLLCDRTAIDPLVYATMKLEPDSVRKMIQDSLFQESLSRYRGKPDEPNNGTGKEPYTTRISLRSTIILTGGVKEWIEDDGIRSLYDPYEVTSYFRDVLERLGMEWHEIGENIKDLQERVDWVLR
ncbi:hypothetical protein CPB86DRAFT_683379, partial [Serendipita vermifera]